MKVRILISFLSVCLISYAQIEYSPQMYPLVVQDIYQSLIEDGKNVDFEEITDELLSLHNNPINLNNATVEDLQQLRFLTDEQIDDILLLVYQHPLHSVWELRLVSSLEDYEVRNLLPFVTVSQKDKPTDFYWREMWHYGKNEIAVRLDARSIENNGNDPFYTSIKYKFNYKKRVEWGIVAERDPQEAFYVPKKTYGADYYGGYLQVKDIWHFKTIVTGDFRASFGEGLVLNTNMSYGGKLSYLTSNAARKEGLQRKSSTTEYDYLRGGGATLRFGAVDITALYSARKVDGKVNEEGEFPSIQRTGYHRTENELAAKREVWQQVAAINTTVRLHQVRFGITGTANILDHTLTPKPNYYNSNYFSGKTQYSIGANYVWHYRKLSVYGEVATASNSRWGIATIDGINYNPISGLKLTALYRYYSPHFDNLLSSAFGETSKANDENGLMLGSEIKLLKHWRFTTYADIFHFKDAKYQIKQPNTTGFEAYVKAEFQPNKLFAMQLLGKNKLKGENNKTSLRYAFTYTIGQWTLKAYLEGNIVCPKNEEEKPTVGGVLAPQAEYSFLNLPITIQARAEAFHIKNYDNRIYLYENDVLYAFSVPMTYGIGGRWLLNCRYKINNHFSLYLKVAQSIWSDNWKDIQNYANSTRTEVHTLLRIKI